MDLSQILIKHIRHGEDTSWTDWDSYVQHHTEGSLFHLSKWKEVVETTFGHQSHYLAAYTQGQIVGVFPLFEMKSMLFGHFMVSVPFAELGGPLADNENVREMLLNRAVEIATSNGTAYLEMKNISPINGLPKKDLYYNFSRRIDADPEANLLAIPRKSRAMVRKGIKAGLLSDWGNHLLDEFYALLSRNYHRLGTPIFPKKFFREFLNVFKDNAELMIVRKKNGDPIAGVLTFYYQNRVMPYYAGSLTEYRALAANDFMYWALLKRGSERGYEIFDFGRSKIDTGSFSFKKNWGFEPRPLAYQYHLVKGEALPNLSPTNPKYAKKIELWRKMPFAMTKMIGPSLAKYLA